MYLIGVMKNLYLWILSFCFENILYKNGNIVDVLDIFFEGIKCVFILYLFSKECLFLLFNLLCLFCSWIIFVVLVRKDFEKVLCLKMIFWYVIIILVFGINGVIILILYFFSSLNCIMLNLNMLIMLLMIKICGWIGL